MTALAAGDTRPTRSPAVGRANGAHPDVAALSAQLIPEPTHRHLSLRAITIDTPTPTPPVALSPPPVGPVGLPDTHAPVGSPVAPVGPVWSAPRQVPVALSTDTLSPLSYPTPVAPVGTPVAPTGVAPVGVPTRQTPAAVAKAVAPLVVVNALAVYGQLAYALANIAPHDWPTPARVALSIGFAAAVESVALYVGWHAHDALLLKAYGTARWLRRASFAIAALVGAMNYAHFAGPGFAPTAAACAFGLLSLLSPWMWGLHSRRQQHIQLLKERKVDEGGAEFSSARRRSFPLRTWQARRWAIDNNVTDPGLAWAGYKADRANRQARRMADRQATRARRQADRQARQVRRQASRQASIDRATAAKPTPVDRTTSTPRPTPRQGRQATPRQAPADTPTGDTRQGRQGASKKAPTWGQPTGRQSVEPTPRQADQQVSRQGRQGDPTGGADRATGDTRQDRQATPVAPEPTSPTGPTDIYSPAVIANAAELRRRYIDTLPDADNPIRQATGWSLDRVKKARAAFLAGADLNTTGA